MFSRYLTNSCFDCDADDALHFLVDSLVVLALRRKVLTEDGHRTQTVTATVGGTVLLQGVIGQVHEVVAKRGGVQAVRSGSETQVALFKDVELAQMVQKHPHPDIELVAF